MDLNVRILNGTGANKKGVLILSNC